MSDDTWGDIGAGIDAGLELAEDVADTAAAGKAVYDKFGRVLGNDEGRRKPGDPGVGASTGGAEASKEGGGFFSGLSDWSRYAGNSSNWWFKYTKGWSKFRTKMKVTLEDVKAMGRMDPISGIAPSGTSLAALRPLQKRDYFASAYAITLFRNIRDLNMALVPIDQYIDIQGKLGWCAPLLGRCSCPSERTSGAGVLCTAEGCMQTLDSCEPVNVVDGKATPSMITPDDVTKAYYRLLDVRRGKIAIPTGPPPAALQTGEEQTQVKPYEAAHTPGKMFESLVGSDDKRYLVLEMGGKVHGAKLSTVLLAGGALTLGGISVGYYLLRTPKGKKLAKKLGLI